MGIVYSSTLSNNHFICWTVAFKRTACATVTHQRFVSALKDVADKMAVPLIHRLSANEAKVVHVANTLKRNV